MFNTLAVFALTLALVNAADKYPEGSDAATNDLDPGYGNVVNSTYCDGKVDIQTLHKKAPSVGTCGDLAAAYKDFECCDKDRAKLTHEMAIPMNPHKGRMMGDANPCHGAKPTGVFAFNNLYCFEDEVVQALEQSGTNVTKGYQGTSEKVSGQVPILATPGKSSYFARNMCPVNVHWHLGTEHLSVGEYDDHGTGPGHHVCGVDDKGSRRLAAEARRGFQCHHYNESDPRFTTEYKWQHCMDMHVGETYEVHWPHSALGACMTPDQFQTPFYDGVFCHATNDTVNKILGGTLNVSEYVGVQGQIFTIINDESYYFPDLMRGMIFDGEYGEDIASYTGSTTGTTRSNKVCSGYTPITWQVDRKCHLISASSFDKMCADMRSQKDDMTGDMYPHGSRELVLDELAAHNHQRRA